MLHAVKAGEESGGEIFDGLSIWKDEKHRNLQGTYPVIFLSFAGIKLSSFDEVRKRLFYLIENLSPNLTEKYVSKCTSKQN